MNIIPLKRFGQNYLVDRNMIFKIIAAFNPRPEDMIIEIGPGKGALTEHLFNKCENFLGVEIDSRNVEILREKFEGINIINKDVLKFDFYNIKLPAGRKFRIIGNIPYNITSQLIYRLLVNRELIDDVMLMLQTEAVNRILAGKGNKDYNVLNLLVKYYTETIRLFNVPGEVFSPRPNVRSAVIKMRFKEKANEGVDFNNFSALLKAAFSSRRKTLKNSMSNSIFKNYILSDKYSNKRVEELDLEDFVAITKSIQESYEE